LILVELSSPDFGVAITVENSAHAKSGQAQYPFFGRQLRIVVYHLRSGSDILLCSSLHSPCTGYQLDAPEEIDE
jgi:hypothetical protein